MSLGYRTMPEGKEVLSTPPKLMGVCQRGTIAKQKSSQWPNLEPFGNKKVAFDYYPKYRINIHECIDRYRHFTLKEEQKFPYRAHLLPKSRVWKRRCD